jgi:hypothetical protein
MKNIAILGLPLRGRPFNVVLSQAMYSFLAVPSHYFNYQKTVLRYGWTKKMEANRRYHGRCKRRADSNLHSVLRENPDKVMVSESDASQQDLSNSAATDSRQRQRYEIRVKKTLARHIR